MDTDVNSNATGTRFVMSSSPGYPYWMLLEANRDLIDALDVGYVFCNVCFDVCYVHCGTIPLLLIPTLLEVGEGCSYIFLVNELPG